MAPGPEGETPPAVGTALLVPVADVLPDADEVAEDELDDDDDEVETFLQLRS